MTLFPPQRKWLPLAQRVWIKRSLMALPLLCLLVFGTIIGSRLFSSTTRASATSLVQLKGNVPGLVKTSTLLGSTDPKQSISLSIGLRLRNAENLKNYVDNISRPKSLTAHQHLTQAEITAAYAPLASSQQMVVDYLQGYGFQTTETGKLHLIIGFHSTIAAAENAFHLQINNYHSSTGQNFYAPSNDPEVPANLATLIQSVIGLDNTAHFAPTITTKQLVSKKASTSNSVAPCPGISNGNPLYYLPSQIASAYNLNGFYNAGFAGGGQTVALFELDNYLPADINAYTSCYGGSNVPIHTIPIDGGPGAPGSEAFIVENDMELILSALPHLAGLDIYEGPSMATDAQFIDTWSKIIDDDSASVISTNWRGCEEETLFTRMQEENSLFTIAAAQGQTIFASSGSTGTNGCGLSLGVKRLSQGVVDLAAQPYITGVGGTSLTLGNSSSYGSETVWNNGIQEGPFNSQAVAASGGGISNMWPMPSWQQGPGVINNYSSKAPCNASSGYCREVPDVSLDADPNTGYMVYCTVQETGCTNTSWWIAGSTNAAAPLWAAFMALVNEKTLHDGGFTIGFLNPYLYQIDQGASGTSYTNDFHDVTVGNNDGLNDGQAIYPATSNYDMATGLGSYNAWNLGQDLEKLANAKNGSRGTSANTTWYFAEGSVGGQFSEYLTLLNPNANQAAHVSVQYLFESQAAVTKTYTIAASSRFTVNVNNDLGIAPTATQAAISAIVTSDVAIVAERPMYFNRATDLSASGTDVLGATNASNTSFYFAAGDTTQTTNDSAKEFITILNPSSTATANITAMYYSGGAVVDTETLNVLPLHRGTIQTPYQGLAAIKVTSNVGVVVERPIYYKGINIPTAGGTVTGAASTVAATVPGDDWLFAEGHTADNFQENLVLANFSTNSTSATIKLEYTNGAVQSVPVTVQGQSQLTFDVNNAYLHPLANFSGTTTADVSIEVISADPIVAERVMFFHYKGATTQGSISGVTDVVGEPGPSVHSTYSFAEGYTTSSFEEWLTLQNPNANAETVAITLFFDGTIVEKEMTLPAHSRTTLNINSIVVPVATAYPSSGDTAYAVSLDVQAFSGTVVVERPLYFNYQGVSPGGTDVIGYTGQ